MLNSGDFLTFFSWLVLLRDYSPVRLALTRAQPELSFVALVTWREANENLTGPAGVLLSASRLLFPLSIGSFARLLSSVIHSQVRSRTPYIFTVIIVPGDTVFELKNGGERVVPMMP